MFDFNPRDEGRARDASGRMNSPWRPMFATAATTTAHSGTVEEAGNATVRVSKDATKKRAIDKIQGRIEKAEETKAVPMKGSIANMARLLSKA